MNQAKVRANGTIEVSQWWPIPYDPGDGVQLVRIDVVESFHGDIEGTGTARMLQALRADGSASFTALERVEATLGGRKGSFVFQDAGTLDASGVVDGTWFVVPGSGTGALRGLRGEGGFTAKLGQHAHIHLDYWFDE